MIFCNRRSRTKATDDILDNWAARANDISSSSMLIKLFQCRPLSLNATYNFLLTPASCRVPSRLIQMLARIAIAVSAAGPPSSSASLQQRPLARMMVQEGGGGAGEGGRRAGGGGAGAS